MNSSRKPNILSGSEDNINTQLLWGNYVYSKDIPFLLLTGKDENMFCLQGGEGGGVGVQYMQLWKVLLLLTGKDENIVCLQVGGGGGMQYMSMKL